MYARDLAVYVRECDGLGYGVIGGDDCPPENVKAGRTKRERHGGRTRRAFRHRREPGERAIRRVCRRAARNGVRTQPTFRAYVSHAFGVTPSPDRVRRVVREFAPDMPARAEALGMLDPGAIAPDAMLPDWVEVLALLDAADTWGMYPDAARDVRDA